MSLNWDCSEERPMRGAEMFGTICGVVGVGLLFWWLVIEFVGQPLARFVSEL